VAELRYWHPFCTTRNPAFSEDKPRPNRQRQTNRGIPLTSPSKGPRMASFSSVQCHQLVNEYWHMGTAYCPHDGRKVEAHYHQHTTGYLLVLACAFCGKKMQVTRFSDPQRDQFRLWSEEEAARLLAEHAMGRYPACPVCGARTHSRHRGGQWLGRVQCPRCGNSQRAPQQAVSGGILAGAAHV
jgi:ribosomal protein L37AE/L43A